ncbi:DUF305 domain-containing protein [Streptomyces dysideae]|uniref:DUF305 domain-containing protein n=1 Tax=Streptomyces dysideae TaxID=909626 RepID=A0A101V4J2_9ACTN|nr:DUF305 domain-containing protein [Streptomyces dysideae]KUO22368.1 hypothetical protein AQJ91_04140 [Streptomyces dysideae]
MTDTTDPGGQGRPRWLIAGAAVLVALALALAFLATTSGENDEGADVPTADSADAGFARDMAVHHQQAVEMSYIVRDGTTDEDIRRLAYDIAQTQANQRGMLLGWLDLWSLPKTSPEGYMAWVEGGGHMDHEARPGALMPGMATNAELARLGGLQGKEAEILFLQLMVDHHMGGVDMARACAQQCEVEPEKKLAQGMVEAQQSEMQLMTDLLKERGAKPRT